MHETSHAMTWVPIGPYQSKEILRLVRAIEENDGTPYRSSHEEILDYFDPAHFWRATAARDYSGKLIAFGLTRTPIVHGPNVEVILSGGVHPDFRGNGAGRQLLGMQLATAEQLVQGESESAVAVMHVDSGNPDLEDLLVRAGFSVSSSYAQMRKPLAEFEAHMEVPSFVTIEPYTQALSEDVRKAHNAIYVEEFARPALTPAQWAAERQYTDIPWSFVAVDRRGDRPRVAGYLLSGRFEQDWESFGWSEGYIQEVAVQHEWRGRNIMRALLGNAMTSYQNDGIEFAGLDADIHPDPAQSNVAMFERLGFERTGTTNIYARNLDVRAGNLLRR
ncbi:MAG: GNAT family N-acetyltransferase [Ancrocorticia sp.]|uniref:GNAT family N-acetyltransferase n=1 Tax=Ancrocorticia sp. TaxID=2593684 RepID=UPI003F92CE6C